MRSAALHFAALAGLSFAVAAACSKPPRTSVDVDTMKEASFVQDTDDGGSKARPVVIKDDADDEPVPAVPANQGPAAPATGADSTKGLPEPEIMSQKLDKPDRPGKKPTGAEKISAADCGKMFDHYFDLLLTTDSRFADVGPEGKAMVRQIASGDARFAQMQKDCVSDVSRARFTCAMAAKTTGAWETCLK
jgi:hypothetical protein